jgi:hypothetical protein
MVLSFIVDDLRELGAMSTFATSRLFGNSIGLVKGRKGHLLDLPPEERRALARSLEPLDVLLEKTPFRLTDKFIPGRYTISPDNVAVRGLNRDPVHAHRVSDPACTCRDDRRRGRGNPVSCLYATKTHTA